MTTASPPTTLHSISPSPSGPRTTRWVALPPTWKAVFCLGQNTVSLVITLRSFDQTQTSTHPCCARRSACPIERNRYRRALFVIPQVVVPRDSVRVPVGVETLLDGGDTQTANHVSIRRLVRDFVCEAREGRPPGFFRICLVACRWLGDWGGGRARTRTTFGGALEPPTLLAHRVERCLVRFGVALRRIVAQGLALPRIYIKQLGSGLGAIEPCDHWRALIIIPQILVQGVTTRVAIRTFASACWGFAQRAHHVPVVHLPHPQTFCTAGAHGCARLDFSYPLRALRLMGTLARNKHAGVNRCFGGRGGTSKRRGLLWVAYEHVHTKRQHPKNTDDSSSRRALWAFSFRWHGSLLLGLSRGMNASCSREQRRCLVPSWGLLFGS